MAARIQTSIRLSAETMALREALSGRLGISSSAVLEMAIRKLADAEGVKVETAPRPKPKRKAARK